MGVPKFFRYISERYPCLSEIVREYQIPEFDNMYLDMNGIIHMCSHPDDNNPHFRITEQKIFEDIFHYLEVLFRMIRPQKLFFMAIDGVAPRAKMNQQRGRRFRSAKDAESQEAEALKKGEILPTEERFDSNCITPGTVFMARLHEQLKYFCADKVSNDPLWSRVKIILSGHETPGEGEHKIMDYIRYIRSQPGYDPNTRHCLYGLDADLIMLGLCSHEPHFSLLREEVKFGRKSTKRQSVPEEITFFLLHLSLMREYLELEFAPIKDKLVGFEFDLEKIIDDWVLMGFLVGNDFIPHLPNLHIANGALPLLYKAYMEVLPTLDGYINEAGTLNLARFEKLMQKLANFDFENFEEIRDDITYMEAKTGRKFDVHSKVSSGRDLEKWISDDEVNGKHFESLEPKNNKSVKNSDLEALIQATDDLDIESEDDDDLNEDEKAFKDFKREYYMNKLEYSNVTPEVLRSQAEGYIRAIQWNLNYYYNGVCSWSWFYPHHYAPYISDIKDFTDLKLEFDLGKPFKPYEQLLGVLPAASRKLLPEAYHSLMTSENSPLKKYYPEEFQTDKNGKRQEWEAVVLIPFMDEKSLLEAMKACNDNLTPEEVQRNTHGPMLAFTRSHEDQGEYEAPEYFPPIKHNYAQVELLTIDNIRVPKEKLVKGIYPGAALDVFYPGFPTMKHLKYTADLRKARVKVFEQPSRNDNMIIEIIQDKKHDPKDIPIELLGQEVFIGWPHLVEGRVVSISNSKMKYISKGAANQYNTEEVKDNWFRAESTGVIDRYQNRLGIEIGPVEILCHTQVMIGRKYVFSPNGRLTFEKQFSDITAYCPLQTIVSNIAAYDSHHSVFRNIEDVFPEGAICFTLSNPYYGAQGIIINTREIQKTGRIKVCVSISDEPSFENVQIFKESVAKSYKTLHNVASQLGMSNFLYSWITSSVYIETPDCQGGFKNVNIGLDLKLNKKNKETPGYTRKIGNTWYYTDKCTESIREYAENFPEVFNYFSNHTVGGTIKVEDIFGDNWEERIKALSDYLRKAPTYSLERQICGSQVVESEIVRIVEKTVDNFLSTVTYKKVSMSVRPAFLYKPEIQTGTLPPDPKMQVQIFDRIINVRKGFTVPFGLKGTIIAITESPTKDDRDTMFDVVFDKPFKGGIQLNCSPERGYRLPRTAFINISYGKRLYEQRTGKDGLSMESGQKTENSWRNTNGQKFFNQFMKQPQPSYFRIPDQFSYYPQKVVPQEPNQGSAFVPFNVKQRELNNTPPEPSKEIQRSENNETSLHRQRDGSDDPNQVKESVGPAFAKKEKTSSTVEQPPAKEVLKERPVDLKNNQMQTRSTVNTNFLRNILKIGEYNTKNATEGTKKTMEPKTSPKRSEPETSANVSFQMLAQQVGNTAASIRLLTYYQSNGLGIPRYQYFRSDDKYKAQISLMNGELIMGESADTKEQATENVASDVLQLLMKKATPSNTLDLSDSKNLPVPPKTWVEPSKGKSLERNDQALKAALHNPFVPTQVMKHKKSKTNPAAPQESNGVQSQSGSSTETRSQEIKTKSSIENPNKNYSSINDSSLRKTKKKTRIAANFGMKK